MKKTSCKFIGFLFFLTMAGPAWADHQHPISCGTTVTDDTTLVGSDPVVSTVCQLVSGQFALKVVAGKKLDLNGRSIRGKGGLGVGVLIDGADGVTITNGGIEGFETGVGTFFGRSSGSKVFKIRAIGNRFGIDIAGDNNTIGGKGSARNICDRNTFGLSISGNNNTLENNRCRANDLDGITVFGNNNTLLRNFAATNGRRGLGDGVLVSGSGNTLRRNQGRTNSGDGVFVSGGGNISDGTNYGHGNGGVQCDIDGVSGDYC